VPQRIDTIVVSTQHDEFDKDDELMLAKIKKGYYLNSNSKSKRTITGRIYRNFLTDTIKYHINPTGKFVIGGPPW